jgi:hypothetical protein
MFEKTGLTIHASTAQAIKRFLAARGDPGNFEAVVEEALLAWLDRAAIDNPPVAQGAARGYLWKSLFLPEGTLIRFDYRRQTHHAEVRGDRIVYQGRPFSPRQLLLHVTGAVRNAWQELWLRCPTDNRWHLADTRRHLLRRMPRGRHLRGADSAQVNAAARARLAARRAAGDPHCYCELPTLALAVHPLQAVHLSAILYRDDLVRADQPDLASKRAGAGRLRAGREGPRDRRDAFARFERMKMGAAGPA